MARYIGPKCRLCRREGVKLYLKGERCYTDKCVLNRRTGKPGQHKFSRRKISAYGMQLREKQKVKRIYGMLEAQFKRFFNKALKMKGITGENLLKLLERRLDNVIYRAGFANSRAQARQFVLHRMFEVNGRVVNIPSYLVKEGDIIKVREKYAEKNFINEIIKENASMSVKPWLDVDRQTRQIKVKEIPNRADIEYPIEEHLIVELYSK